MNAAGFLLPPEVERTPEQVVLWNTTFERIQPFLPDLREDLFPTPPLVVPFEKGVAELNLQSEGDVKSELV